MNKIRRTATAAFAFAVVAGGVLTGTPAFADNPVPAPFTAPAVNSSVSWCPSYHGLSGCGNVQSPSSPAFNIPFDPAQVTTSGKNGYVNLTMTATKTGAFNTQTRESFPIGSTFAEKIIFPCTSSNTIAGWPAFWTDGTATGSNFAPGEIDIAEGLHGAVKGNIHFKNAQGTEGSLGNTYPGTLCGTAHTYAAIWDSTKVAFYLDGVWQWKFTPADMGVPMFTDNQWVINDYGSGSFGATDVFPSTMQVQKFSTTSVGPL